MRLVNLESLIPALVRFPRSLWRNSNPPAFYFQVQEPDVTTEYYVPAALNDYTHVELTEDQYRVSLAMTEEIVGAVGTLQALLRNKNILVSNRYSCLSVAEYCLRRLQKATGYDQDLETAKDADTANIRALNLRVRELEDQLKVATPIAGLGARLHDLDSTINRWWVSLGFAVCYGSFVATWPSQSQWSGKLSFYISDCPPSRSDTPDSDEKAIAAKIEAMRSTGLVLADGPGQNAHYVVDCQESKQWVLARLAERFPGFYLGKWTSGRYSGMESCFYLTEAEVTIPLADILEKELPATIAEEK